MDLQHILSDEAVKAEFLDKLHVGELPASLTTNTDTLRLRELVERYDTSRHDLAIHEEAIVREFTRPSLLVRHNTFDVPSSDTWKQRLDAGRQAIEQAIPAVGRIEIRDHPTREWLGTGWLVASDVVVTNRHVASEFAKKQGNRYVFRQNFDQRFMQARIDFREEYRQPEQIEFQLTEVLHIEDDLGPDMALCRVAQQSGSGSTLAQPIPLTESLSTNQNVVVIGYPFLDTRRREPEALLNRIFHNIYDVKRVSPGQIGQITDDRFTHDCSTLGGNSGSVVLDIRTAAAVGMHFGGRYRQNNYAVPASTIAARLVAHT